MINKIFVSSRVRELIGRERQKVNKHKDTERVNKLFDFVVKT